MPRKKSPARAKTSTKKSASKKSSSKTVNKTQAVKELLDENGNISPIEITEILKKKGIEVTTAYVSTIKTNLKNKKKKGGAKRGTKRSTKKSASNSSINLDAVTTVEAVKVVKGYSGGDESRLDYIVAAVSLLRAGIV